MSLKFECKNLSIFQAQDNTILLYFLYFGHFPSLGILFCICLQASVLSKQEASNKKKMSLDDSDDYEDNGYGDVNDKSTEGNHFLDEIDHYALRIFPFMFVIFNTVYWCLYLFFLSPGCL